MRDIIERTAKLNELAKEKMKGLPVIVESSEKYLSFKTYFAVEPSSNSFDEEGISLNGEVLFSSMIAIACDKHFREVKSVLSSPLDILTLGLTKDTPSSIAQSFVEKDLSFFSGEVASECIVRMNEAYSLVKARNTSSQNESKVGFLFVSILSGECGKNFYSHVYFIDNEADIKSLIKVRIHR